MFDDVSMKAMLPLPSILDYFNHIKDANSFAKFDLL